MTMCVVCDLDVQTNMYCIDVINAYFGKENDDAVEKTSVEMTSAVRLSSISTTYTFCYGLSTINESMRVNDTKIVTI